MTLASILTFCLPGQMSFITIAEDIGSLLWLDIFVEPLFINIWVTRYLTRIWTLVIFFWLLKVCFLINKISIKVGSVISSLVWPVDLLPVGRSKRVFLKVSTSTIWLLFNTNLLIFRDWFFVRVFSYNSSSFLVFFFCLSYFFHLNLYCQSCFASSYKPLISKCSNLFVLNNNWIVYILHLLEYIKSLKVGRFWAQKEIRKVRLISSSSGGQFVCKHRKISFIYLNISCQGSKNLIRLLRLVSNPFDLVKAAKQFSDKSNSLYIAFFTSVASQNQVKVFVLYFVSSRIWYAIHSQSAFVIRVAVVSINRFCWM